MKKIFFCVALISIATVSSCTKSEVGYLAISSPSAKPTVDTNNKQLSDQIKQIADTSKGHVGVAAILLDRFENQPIVSLNAGDHFPMQSVYKLPISMAVLKQVDEGKLSLDEKVRIAKADFVGSAAHSPIRDQNPKGTELTVADLLRFAIVESDGTASDVLMKLAGGPEQVNSYLRELAIADIVVRNTENEFSKNHALQYDNWATPDAALALLRALNERRNLSDSSQALLLRLMTESKPGAKRLKGALPAGTSVAHKTGTSGTEKGVTAATNDIGIITLPDGRKFAIAVFVSDSPADEATREGVIANISRAVWDYLIK